MQYFVQNLSNFVDPNAGVVLVAADLKDQKITVIGDADPVCLTASLREFGFAESVSVGPSIEPEKKPATAKEEGEKKAGGKREPPKEIHTCVIIPTSCNYCSSYTYYLSDDNPNACCIV